MMNYLTLERHVLSLPQSIMCLTMTGFLPFVSACNIILSGECTTGPLSILGPTVMSIAPFRQAGLSSVEAVTVLAAHTLTHVKTVVTILHLISTIAWWPNTPGDPARVTE